MLDGMVFANMEDGVGNLIGAAALVVDVNTVIVRMLSMIRLVDRLFRLLRLVILSFISIFNRSIKLCLPSNADSPTTIASLTQNQSNNTAGFLHSF